jgi:mRNA interferase MazF
VRRGEVFWGDLGSGGRRPVVILTRSGAIGVRTRVTVAPVTTTIRGIRSEVPVGPEEGLAQDSVISCDNLLTLDKRAFDLNPVGRLDPATLARLDAALRFALKIRS